MKSLNIEKLCLKKDFLVKSIKIKLQLFNDFIHHNSNNSLFSAGLPPIIKNTGAIQTYKKKNETNI